MSKGSLVVFVGLAVAIYYLLPTDPRAPVPSFGAGGGPPVTITPSNFEQEVVLSAQPVLAYFWASW